jgi:predicted metalloprotease with PDZ domain
LRCTAALAALLALLACNPPDVHEPAVHDEAEVVAASPVPAPGGAVAYLVRIEAPHTHLIEVEATAPTAGADEVVWMMPTWTPGSYLVREFARQVEGVSAVGEDGQPREVRKLTKNRWAVDARGTSVIRLDYRLYARELSVRTNWVDADLGMLNGASTFLTPVGAMQGGYEVQLELPAEWTDSVTGLEPHPDGGEHRYVAQDFDELVDSPIVAGTPVVHLFEVAGVRHRLANFGGDGLWDQERSLGGVKAIVEEQARFWGQVPYPHYTFLNVIAEAGGGLEHLDSTLMLTFRDRTSEDDLFEKWLGLVSHELFHAWNVKRLRPEALGPFDYEQEQYTPSLWVAEGLTSYYDDLLLIRAGLIDEEAYLGRLGEAVAQLQAAPGRLVQPVTLSSHDAWIKYYRGDENSRNSSVSYYVKGAVVGWLLDAEIRRLTQDRHSLDDVMRLAYARHSGERGYSEQAFRDLISEVAQTDLTGWLDRHLDQAVELEYAPALAWWGLSFAKPSEDPPEAWLGLEAGGEVKEVGRETPAWRAGINVGDELIAVAGARTTGDLAALLKAHKPGEVVEVTLARRGRLRTLQVTLEAKPVPNWAVKVDPLAGTAASLRRERWLGQR